MPAAPEESSSANSQFGEEKMVKVEDPSGKFTILFVDTWLQESGNTPNSLRSKQDEWVAEVEIVSANDQTPEQAVQALNASQANNTSGYKKLALQSGSVHGLPAFSLIYEYGSGVNPVTEKPLRYIGSQVFVGGGPAGLLGHLTFSAPASFYGDVSEIFDKILSGYDWKPGATQ